MSRHDGSHGYDLLLRGGTVVTAEDGAYEADVAVRDGQIAALLAPGSHAVSAEVVDCVGLHILPGAIDPHTHWGFSSGTFEEQCASDSMAAAIGGVTTALLFHRMDPRDFPALKQAAEDRSMIDFAFSPAIFDEASAGALEEMIEGWGCTSIKFYLAYRDIPHALPGDTWNRLTDGMFFDCLQRMSRYPGVLACVHAESAEILAQTRMRASREDTLRSWADANPGVAEGEAILRAAYLTDHFGVPLYIVHLSGAEAVSALARARTFGGTVYGETCPHYLAHNIETSSTVVKFSPPVRTRHDNEVLWDGLAGGVLDCVGSDNASTRLSDKQGNVWEISRGIAGTGTLLPLVLSEGVNAGRISLQRAVAITSANAARIFGLYPQKGTIAVGTDADLAAVDLGKSAVASAELLRTWSDFNAYSHLELRGWPQLTVVRGQVVAREGEIVARPGTGQFLARDPWAAHGHGARARATGAVTSG